MIAIREGMEIVVLHPLQIELVEEGKGRLHVHVVVAGAVHHEEADVAREAGHVADGGVVVAALVVLRGVHVAFGVDGVWRESSASSPLSIQGRRGVSLP